MVGCFKLILLKLVLGQRKEDFHNLVLSEQVETSPLIFICVFSVYTYVYTYAYIRSMNKCEPMDIMRWFKLTWLFVYIIIVQSCMIIPRLLLLLLLLLLGNHYCEIQVVDEIYDVHAAARMGIDKIGEILHISHHHNRHHHYTHRYPHHNYFVLIGQICIMIHSGSRGLGTYTILSSIHPSIYFTWNKKTDVWS